MPIRVQSFYPSMAAQALSFLARPSGYVGPWQQTNPAGCGTYARYMGPALGTAQVATTHTWASVPDPASRSLAVAQFLSDPLRAQSVAAGAWVVGFGGRLANAGATYSWNGGVGLYVIDGRTGRRRSTIINTTVTVGAVRTNTTERTVRSSIAGAAFELLTGDYLCLELGIIVVNNGAGATVPQATLYTDGTSAILADNAATASAQAALVAPVAFELTLAQAGEPPAPSRTYDEALEEMRRAWPPNAPHDFENPAAPDYGLLRWMAQLYKTFISDMLDLMAREVDPRQASWIKLQDWRAIFAMSQNPPATASKQLTALVISRLREIGGPSNEFNVAAVVGLTLGYADPTALEILKLSTAQIKSGCTYTFVPAAKAISDVATFNGNLIQTTTFINDGGVCWETGVQLTLNFSASVGARVHVQLESPDGFLRQWQPITKWLSGTQVILYGREFAGHSVNGQWKLYIYREPGSTAANLNSWTLYVAGAPRYPVGPDPGPWPVSPPVTGKVPSRTRFGLGQWAFWFGVYADPTKMSAVTPADFGAAMQALGRLRQAGQRADLILSKAPIPGAATSLPGMCVPGT